MDRYVSITLFFIVLQGASGFVGTWGLGATPTGVTQITQNQLATANGCTYNTNGVLVSCVGGAGSSTNCSGLFSCMSYAGQGLFQYVLFIGDWLFALQRWVSYFFIVMVLPGQYLSSPPYNVPATIVNMITVAMYFDYFLFTILFLRGGRQVI